MVEWGVCGERGVWQGLGGMGGGGWGWGARGVVVGVGRLGEREAGVGRLKGGRVGLGRGGDRGRGRVHKMCSARAGSTCCIAQGPVNLSQCTCCSRHVSEMSE